MAWMAGSSVLLPALCVHISISPLALLPPPPRFDEQLMRVRGRATIAATTPARRSAVEIPEDPSIRETRTPGGRKKEEPEAFAGRFPARRGPGKPKPAFGDVASGEEMGS